MHDIVHRLLDVRVHALRPSRLREGGARAEARAGCSTPPGGGGGGGGGPTANGGAVQRAGPRRRGWGGGWGLGGSSLGRGDRDGRVYALI